MSYTYTNGMTTGDRVRSHDFGIVTVTYPGARIAPQWVRVELDGSSETFRVHNSSLVPLRPSEQLRDVQAKQAWTESTLLVLVLDALDHGLDPLAHVREVARAENGGD